MGLRMLQRRYVVCPVSHQDSDCPVRAQAVNFMDIGRCDRLLLLACLETHSKRSSYNHEFIDFECYTD